MRGRQWGLLLWLLLAPPAWGAFECVPGPAPGGLADWAWQQDDFVHGPHCTLALARPAAIDGLSWSYARVAWSARPLAVSGDAYTLALEDLYRESSASLWAGVRRLGVGIRRWQTVWGDGTRRGGWTWEAEARRSRGALALRLSGQGLPLGRTDSAGPSRRFALAVDLRPRRDLVLGLAAVRADQGSLLIAHADWSALPRITLGQAVRFPESSIQSSLELKSDPFSLAFWVEPNSSLGTRTGVRCTLR